MLEQQLKTRGLSVRDFFSEKGSFTSSEKTPKAWVQTVRLRQSLANFPGKIQNLDTFLTKVLKQIDNFDKMLLKMESFCERLWKIGYELSKKGDH